MLGELRTSDEIAKHISGTRDHVAGYHIGNAAPRPVAFARAEIRLSRTKPICGYYNKQTRKGTNLSPERTPPPKKDYG
jgi:hypothetical protein